MSAVAKLWLSLIFVLTIFLVGIFFMPSDTAALHVRQYRDTISDSAPVAAANHTFEFYIDTDVNPGGRLEFTPPAGFEIINAATFGVRNVELLVNGVSRTAAVTAAPGVDQVEITPGSPGFIRYTLAPDFSIAAGSQIEFRIGNQTTYAADPVTSFSSTTGTTTTPADIEPILNSATLGTHEFDFEVWDGGLKASAGFLISVNNRVSIPGVDTTEIDPPVRFNGAPTSTVGGTTLSVEISLETDEFAVCRYSSVAGVSFTSMPATFSSTGLLFHSVVVSVVPDSVQTFYVRCIDDEGNFNKDDYIITFTVTPVPTGEANTDGSTDGDGTGSGNNGSGSGSGGGGSSGGSSGVEPTTGGSSGSGGSGGGGGGGRGDKDGSTAGGGFESEDAPYRSGDARVVITGYAFPNSTVTFLVDGTIADTVRTNGNGEYSVTLDEIARGAYTFGVYAEGSDKVRSSTFSTSFTVTGARTSELSNINVAPSIKVSPDPVDPGQTLTVTGYSLPNATITLEYGKKKFKQQSQATAIADGSGKWSTTLVTTNFSKGTYQIRAKAARTDGKVTNFSEYTYFGVGESAETTLNADLSRDGKINLTDFSILLFWWGGDGGNSNPPADINRDGKVNLTDFSILLFNWTG
jgi:hypothetical protein